MTQSKVDPKENEFPRVGLSGFLESEGARSALIATISSILIFGGFIWFLVSRPAWPDVRDQFFSWERARESWPAISNGFILDIKLFVVGEILILGLALLIAVMRSLRGPAFFPLRLMATTFIDVLRGIPVILLILIMGFGIPALGTTGIFGRTVLGIDSQLFWGMFAIVLSYSAYTAEVYRSGIDSVHESQSAGARSLGLSQAQGMWHVILPQAIRNVVPALMNGLISLQKDVALVYILGVREAVRESQINVARNFNYTPYVVVAVLFLALSIPMARFADWYTERDRRRRTIGRVH
ncbi:MAG: amino acid ABC transporter permease [Acidimicrobiales bacterium]